MPSSSRTTPIESNNLKTLQSPDPITDITITSLANKFQESTQGNEESSLTSYFGVPSPASSFFDDISTGLKEENEKQRNEDRNKEESQLLTYFNTSESGMLKDSGDNIGMPKYFDNTTEAAQAGHALSNDEYTLFPTETSPLPVTDPETTQNNEEQSSSDEDAVAQDYPEIKQSDLEQREYLRKSSFPVVHFQQDNSNNYFSPTDNQKLFDYLGSGPSPSERADINNTNDQIDNSSDLTKREIQDSRNVESLKQLSDQLAQMMEPTYEYESLGSITDLEKRNIEFAANLETERLQSRQLQAINTQLQSRIAQLEAEHTTSPSNDLHNAQEILRLKTELQNHLQTIGLLVAEKTELSSNLSQYELTCKQKTTDCEELQARLKASRGRVADMERELANLKSEKAKSESLEEQYSKGLENLRQEYKSLKEQKDELFQDVLEVREKLKTVMEENVRWQQENKVMSWLFPINCYFLYCMVVGLIFLYSDN